jgi:hypothetical protein
MTEDDVQKTLVCLGKLTDGFFLERIAEHYIELRREGVEPADIRDRLVAYFDALHGERARILAELEPRIRSFRPQHQTLQ